MKIESPGAPGPFLESSENSKRRPGGSRALQGASEGAPEELPGAFRAPLWLPFEHLGGSFSLKIDDREAFLSEKHVPTWADDEKHL